MRAMGEKHSPRHNNKAFKWRFVLDVRKLRNFHVLSEHCNIECPLDVFIYTPPVFCYTSLMVVYII